MSRQCNYGSGAIRVKPCKDNTTANFGVEKVDQDLTIRQQFAHSSWIGDTSNDRTNHAHLVLDRRRLHVGRALVGYLNVQVARVASVRSTAQLAGDLVACGGGQCIGGVEDGLPRCTVSYAD